MLSCYKPGRHQFLFSSSNLLIPFLNLLCPNQNIVMTSTSWAQFPHDKKYDLHWYGYTASCFVQSQVQYGLVTVLIMTSIWAEVCIELVNNVKSGCIVYDSRLSHVWAQVFWRSLRMKRLKIWLNCQWSEIWEMLWQYLVRKQDALQTAV